MAARPLLCHPRDPAAERAPLHGRRGPCTAERRHRQPPPRSRFLARSRRRRQTPALGPRPAAKPQPLADRRRHRGRRRRRPARGGALPARLRALHSIPHLCAGELSGLVRPGRDPGASHRGRSASPGVGPAREHRPDRSATCGAIDGDDGGTHRGGRSAAPVQHPGAWRVCRRLAAACRHRPLRAAGVQRRRAAPRDRGSAGVGRRTAGRSCVWWSARG